MFHENCSDEAQMKIYQKFYLETDKNKRLLLSIFDINENKKGVETICFYRLGKISFKIFCSIVR